MSLELYEDFLENSRNRKLVFWGASLRGLVCMGNLPEKVYCFGDSDEKKWGTCLNGVSVRPTGELLKEAEEIVIVVTSVFFDEISKQLKDMGFKHIYPFGIFYYRLLNAAESFSRCCIIPINAMSFDGSEYRLRDSVDLINGNTGKINEVRSSLCDEKSRYVFDTFVKNLKYNYYDYSDILEPGKHYFPEGIFTFSDDEIFIDAGCYDCANTLDFIEAVGGKFSQAYCFEPDSISYDRCCDIINSIPAISGRCTVIKGGLSDGNKTMQFHESGATDSGVSASRGSVVDVQLYKLDDKVDRATFIKMDIEGEELNALAGAENIIKKCKPKLAISIYHKYEDLWEIPLYIKQLVPEYRFYMRHHSSSYNEKVLYATI